MKDPRGPCRRRTGLRIGSCGLVLAIASFACGGAPPPSRELAPAPDRDPEPWVASPSDHGVAGTSASLTLAGGRDEARSLALRFLTAVRDADEPTLTQLLDDPLARAQPRPSTPHLPRAQVLELVLRSPRRADLGPNVAIEELAEVDAIEITPLSEVISSVPRGLAPSDLFVAIPLTARGRAVLRFLVPGWHLRGALVLRRSPEGWRVVGV